MPNPSILPNPCPHCQRLAVIRGAYVDDVVRLEAELSDAQCDIVSLKATLSATLTALHETNSREKRTREQLRRLLTARRELTTRRSSLVANQAEAA